MATEKESPGKETSILKEKGGIDVELRASSNYLFRRDSIEFHLGAWDRQDNLYLAEPITISQADPDSRGRHGDSSFAMTKEAATKLMDDLWNIGIRPTFDRDVKEGHLDAVNKHLADMRRIAFGCLQMGGE